MEKYFVSVAFLTAKLAFLDISNDLRSTLLSSDLATTRGYKVLEEEVVLRGYGFGEDEGLEIRKLKLEGGEVSSEQRIASLEGRDQSCELRNTSSEYLINRGILFTDKSL